MIVGTIFESTKLALTPWFLAIYVLTQSMNNVSALELERHSGVCYKTAWLLKHKLMEVTPPRRALSDFAAESPIRPLTVVPSGLACFAALREP